MAQGYFDDIPPVRRPAPVERPGSAPNSRRRPPAEAAPSVPEAQGDTEPSRLGQFAAPMMAQPPESGPGLFDDIPPAQDVSTLGDVVKSAGAGLVKGGIGLAALPGTVEQLGRTGINYVGQKIIGIPETVAPQAVVPGYQQIKGAIEENITGPLYNPKTTAGEYAGTIAEFAPGMLFPAGAGTGLAARAGLNVVAPAVASETAGQLTKGTAAEPYARLAGGLAGGMLPAMAGRAVSPGATNPTRQRMATVLDNEGVTLTAGDRSGRENIRYAESVAAGTPFGGRRLAQIKEQQAEQFTRAALRRAGIQADRALPEVVDQNFARLGNEFDTLAAQTGMRGPQGRAAAARIQAEMRNFEREVPQALQPRIINELGTEIAQTISTQAVDGRQYQTWRTMIDRMARSADAPVQQTLYAFRNALDDAMQASAPRALADRWRQVRRDYRNMLVIEKAVLGAGENAASGLISPVQLAQATKQLQGGRNYARGRGDYAELARAGATLLQPLPQSGTQPRLMISGIGAGIGGAMFGAPGAISGQALAPAVGQAIQARMTGRPTVQAYLGNQIAAPVANLPQGSRIGAAPGSIAGSNRPQDSKDKRRRQTGLLP